jgi:hypothetical protein
MLPHCSWHKVTQIQRCVFSSATETCRDLGHVQLGYATLVNTAETAWQQGVDLYGEEQDRLIAGAQVLCSPLACYSERH